jgi:hypothetical protein
MKKEIATFFEYAILVTEGDQDIWQITQYGKTVKIGGLEVVAMFVEIPYGEKISQRLKMETRFRLPASRSLPLR